MDTLKIQENSSELDENTTPIEANEGGQEHPFGKFKSVEALLSAYTSLEAEFTRRSQKLKELEEKVVNLQQATADKASNPNVDLQTRATVQTTLNNEKDGLAQDVQDLIVQTVQQYMQNQAQVAAPPILQNFGGFAKAPKQHVNSIAEAGKLAEAFFKKIQ